MPRKKSDPSNRNPNLRDLVRQSARTGVAVSSGIIVDRKRVAALVSERRQSESIQSEHIQSEQRQSEQDRMKPGELTDSQVTTISGGISATPIEGTVIGGAQVASFPSLKKHLADICNCQKCPLGATRQKFVYGVGNPKADIMFIGEAPGKNEDEQGEPFVGRAGKLLDKILEAIDLSRSDIYIANILKCRPPGNRDPQPGEMEHCFPYLKEQIALIQPKLLCALGRISSQALLQNTLALGKMRGVWHSYQGIPLRVTYHPAALLRNPNFKRGCWEDIKILRAEYDRLLAEESNSLA